MTGGVPAPGPVRVRVCHVITKLELGGAQQNTLYTVRNLDRQRFEPSLLTGTGGLLDAEAAALPGVPHAFCPHLVREISPVRDARALAELVSRLREWRPHVVHTHSSKAGILGRLAAALTGVPIVVHSVHGWGFHPYQSPLVRGAYVLAERAAALATTRWIAVSEANAEAGVQYGIAPRDAFEIIHSGISLSRFREAAASGQLRAELALGPDVPLVGMVACLKPQKAPQDFVRVAAAVARAHPAAHFVLAGDGKLRGEVERMVRDAELTGRFHLLGWRRDPEVVVGDLDVLVLTSKHEGLPRVLPEAMAAGRPVVATAVDGSPEAIEDARSGFLRPFGDIEGLAAAVIELLGKPDMARQFGMEGRKRADAWDIDQMVRDQEALYERLATRAGLAPAGGFAVSPQGPDVAADG